MKYSPKLSLSLFLSIITLISSLRTNLKTSLSTKMELRTKNDGSGTWLDGYNCPGIELKVGNTSDKYSKYSLGYFYANYLNSSVTPYELGIPFNFTDSPTNENMLKLFTHYNGSIYYIPFSSLTSNLTYSNPSYFSYQMILGEAKVANKSISFKILLPYGTFSRYLSHKEGEDIVNTLNINMEKYYKKFNLEREDIQETTFDYFSIMKELEEKYQNESLYLNETTMNSSESIENKTKELKKIQRTQDRMKNDLLALYKSKDALATKITKEQNNFKTMSKYFKEEFKSFETILNEPNNDTDYFTFTSNNELNTTSNSMKAKYMNLAQLNREIKKLFTEQNDIEYKINETNTDISEGEKEINSIKKELREKQNIVDEYEKKHNNLTKTYEEEKLKITHLMIEYLDNMIKESKELSNGKIGEQINHCIDSLKNGRNITIEYCKEIINNH